MTGRYQAYTDYRSSEASWCGNVPTHWQDVKFKWILEEKKKTSNTSLKAGSISFGKVVYKDEEKLAPETKASYQEVLKGELLINPLNLNFDLKSLRTALSDLDVVVSTGYIVAYISKGINRNYMRWVMHQFDVSHMKTMGSGVRQTINYTDIANSMVCIAPTPEQQKIANFLDHETAKIDTLITKQEKLIELLKEKRQAVISHAVTKGLNPNAPMKDSGVEWLGEVPEHWEVSSLKYFASIQGGYAFNSNEFVDSGVQILRIGNVYQNRLALERQPTFVNDTLYNQLPEFRVTKGDILMSLTGTLGKRDYGFAVKVDLGGHYLLNQRVAKLTPDSQKITRSFLLNVLWSESYLTQLYALPSGTKQANLSNSDVLRNIVAVPPSKEEQQEITLYLEEKLEKLDKLTRLAKEAILLMKERKSALISAAVTGKIDVRDWVGDRK
ncbi:restriction endonuclease subunit S [Vibrio parahaemolyticus]